MIPANMIGPYGELAVVEKRRVRIRTEPGDYNHLKIRKVADRKPYYLVEDQYGNTGFYQQHEMELV